MQRGSYASTRMRYGGFSIDRGGAAAARRRPCRPCKDSRSPAQTPGRLARGGGFGPGAVSFGGGRATGVRRAQGHGATCPPRSCQACLPCSRFNRGAGWAAVYGGPGQGASEGRYSAARAEQGAGGLAHGRACNGAGWSRDGGRAAAGCPRVRRGRVGAARLGDGDACDRAVQGGPDATHSGGGAALPRDEALRSQRGRVHPAVHSVHSALAVADNGGHDGPGTAWPHQGIRL